MAFLTLEDPNAKIKGSRDPLGMVPIWIGFARHFIKNLTTPSGSVRGYTILLLGRYFGAQLIEAGKVPVEAALDVGLRMEQLGAYARHLGHRVEGDIRGIERVKAFAKAGNGHVTIQTNKEGFILSDQKVYGLWGLFSVPSRTSGLIPEGPLGVTPVTAQFIERHYLPILQPHLTPLLKILSRGGQLNTRRWPGYFEALVKIIPESYTPAERDFYGTYIRDGDAAPDALHSSQAQLSRLLAMHSALDDPTGWLEVRELAKQAEKVNVSLARALHRVLTLEALLAPADALFNYILLHHHLPPKEVAARLASNWGTQVSRWDPDQFRELLPEIEDIVGEPIRSSIWRCYQGLAMGKLDMAIEALVDWNAQVMAARKSAPWVKVGEQGRLDVRYRGTDQALPDAEALPELWRNSYFLDSLKKVTRTLQEVA